MVRVKFILLFLFSFPLISHSQVRSLYNVSCGETIFGEPINLKNYQGKVLLIVNSASSHSRFPEELNQLRLLLTMYADSGLVVLIFPTNSFGKESKTNLQLQKTFVQREKIIVAAVAAVTGPTIHSLYDWLATKEKNGKAAAPVKADFQKYLIDKSGNLVGYFSGTMFPTDSTLLHAIESQFH